MTRCTYPYNCKQPNGYGSLTNLELAFNPHKKNYYLRIIIIIIITITIIKLYLFAF